MKQNSLYWKGFVITVIVLLVSLATVPTISGNVKDRGLRQEDDRLTNTYVDIDGDDRYDFDMDECYYIDALPSIEPLFWWTLLIDLPGRYEPFFDVKDIQEYGQGAIGLASADFNKDDLLDFVVIWRHENSFEGGISMFINNGDNSFSEQLISTIEDLHLDPDDDSASPPSSDLDAADYDNDGDIDLLFTYHFITEYENELIIIGSGIILFNNGDNQFNHWEIVFQHYPRIEPNDRINPQVTSADFDDDGDVDFIVGDNSGLVVFYLNDGSGHFSKKEIFDFGGERSWGLANADFDNDGDTDFIVTQSDDIRNGWIYLVQNIGSEDCFNHSDLVKIADLPPDPSFFTMVQAGSGCLHSIDYNNDGTMDFVFCGSDSIFLYMQNETGDFDYFTLCRFPAISDGFLFWRPDNVRFGGITVGDFNGDALDDMVVGSALGYVRLFTNQYVLIDIIKPDRSCLFVNDEIKIYFDGIFLLPFLKYGTSIVIGDITIVAKELQPLSKVEFYLDNNLIYVDDSSPFEWEWSRFSFGRHKVKAVAYDMDGEQAGFDDTIIWKFL